MYTHVYSIYFSLEVVYLLKVGNDGKYNHLTKTMQMAVGTKPPMYLRLVVVAARKHSLEF